MKPSHEWANDFSHERAALTALKNVAIQTAKERIKILGETTMKQFSDEEKWVLGGASGRMITTENGYVGDGFIADVDTKENASRIVACVNACKGIPIEMLEEAGNGAVLTIGTSWINRQLEETCAELERVKEENKRLQFALKQGTGSGPKYTRPKEPTDV